MTLAPTESICEFCGRIEAHSSHGTPGVKIRNGQHWFNPLRVPDGPKRVYGKPTPRARFVDSDGHPVWPEDDWAWGTWSRWAGATNANPHGRKAHYKNCRVGESFPMNLEYANEIAFELTHPRQLKDNREFVIPASTRLGGRAR